MAKYSKEQREAEALNEAAQTVVDAIDSKESQAAAATDAPSAKKVLKDAQKPTRNRMRLAGQALTGAAVAGGAGALTGALSSVPYSLAVNGALGGARGDELGEQMLDNAGTLATTAGIGAGVGEVLDRMGAGTRLGVTAVTGVGAGAIAGLVASAAKAFFNNTATDDDLQTIAVVADQRGVTPEELLQGFAAGSIR